MDVDFIYDTDNRVHYIEFDGEHKALANFLNSEFHPGRYESKSLKEFVERLEAEQGDISFSEWTVSFDRNEVSIANNAIKTQANPAHEDTYHVMEWEYQYSCGKLDILAVLMDWIDFIEQS